MCSRQLEQFWSNLGPSWPNLPILGLSWDSFGAARGYLGPSRGHLETSWGHLGTTGFLETPVLVCPCSGFAVLGHLGVHLETQNLFFLGSFLGLFLDHFWGDFGTHFGDPSRATKYRKPAFTKTLKNQRSFNVFGVQGRLRQLGKAQERSQEAPEEI